MAQSFTSDRIIFEKGKQGEFILACKLRLGCTWTSLANILNISPRTLQNWSKEKKKMSYDSAVILSKKSSIDLPEKIKIMKWSDHLKNISIKGGKARYSKYGMVSDEDIRKKAWEDWWETKGKYDDNKIFKRKLITTPSKSVLLAEFVGIMIGDGSINNYTVRVTLDSLVDKDYIPYIVLLVKQLFNIDTKIYKHKKFRATDIIIQSRNLVEFCNSIGLKIGNKIKQNTDIPDWIKENTEFSIACVRGLVDTDGCFFNHSYNVNGKRYSYTKIAFTNRCLLVLQSVKIILINLGFRVRITKDGDDLRIENQKDVVKYMKVIGTSNPKFKTKLV